MKLQESFLEKCIATTSSRFEFWACLLDTLGVENMAELGVYRGDFAKVILERCDNIHKYYMVDPWKHLDNWNKPANKEDDIFEKFLEETKSKTEFVKEKRIFLRGKTTEVVNKIPDGGLDFAYVDGDHTLKGISIDLIRIYPKIKDGGLIGGDDFSKTIWQHSTKYEPTLVFPFAIYFAEAVGARIYALPNAQFLIEKSAGVECYEFVDLTGEYREMTLRSQFLLNKLIKTKFMEYARYIKSVFK